MKPLTASRLAAAMGLSADASPKATRQILTESHASAAQLVGRSAFLFCR